MPVEEGFRPDSFELVYCCGNRLSNLYMIEVNSLVVTLERIDTLLISTDRYAAFDALTIAE